MKKNFLPFYSAALLLRQHHVVKESSFSKEMLPHAHFDDSIINVFDRKKKKKEVLIMFPQYPFLLPCIATEHPDQHFQT